MLASWRAAAARGGVRDTLPAPSPTAPASIFGSDGRTSSKQAHWGSGWGRRARCAGPPCGAATSSAAPRTAGWRALPWHSGEAIRGADAGGWAGPARRIRLLGRPALERHRQLVTTCGSPGSGRLGSGPGVRLLRDGL
jgi:hypothetical protein